MARPEDAAMLRSKDWPSLRMVIVTDVESQYIVYTRLLQHDWKVMTSLLLQKSDVEDHSRKTRFAWLHWALVMLVMPSQPDSQQVTKQQLPEQHVLALSCLIEQERPNIRALKLNAGRAGAQALAAVIMGSWPCLLETDAKHVARLCRNHWSNIGSLSLDGCSLDAASMTHLVSSSLMSRLTSLTLRGCWLDATAVACLGTGHCPCLELLDLSDNLLGVDGVQVLVKCKLPMLQQLDLCKTGIAAAAAKYLAEGHWPLLESLDLCFNHFDAEAAAYWPNWPLLNDLRFSAG